MPAAGPGCRAWWGRCRRRSRQHRPGALDRADRQEAAVLAVLTGDRREVLGAEPIDGLDQLLLDERRAVLSRRQRRLDLHLDRTPALVTELDQLGAARLEG